MVGRMSDKKDSLPVGLYLRASYGIIGRDDGLAYSDWNVCGRLRLGEVKGPS